MSKSVSPLPEQQVKPKPALEKRSRRTFSADYKLKIIQKAEDCEHGELGALLRKEWLYHTQLSEWRKEFAADGIAVLIKARQAQNPKPRQNKNALFCLKKKTPSLKNSCN